MRTTLIAALLWLFQTGSGEFTISIDGSRVGREEFSISRNAGGFVATGRTRLQVNGENVQMDSRMELDADLNPTSYEYRSEGRRLEMDIGDPATDVRVTIDGEVTSYQILFPAGAMIVDDNFFHHYILLMERVGQEGGAVEVFVPQQLTEGTVEVRAVGDGTYDLLTENLSLRASVDSDGRLIRLVGLDSNVVIER
jgi:hypothetical protein